MVCANLTPWSFQYALSPLPRPSTVSNAGFLGRNDAQRSMIFCAAPGMSSAARSSSSDHSPSIKFNFRPSLAFPAGFQDPHAHPVRRPVGQDREDFLLGVDHERAAHGRMARRHAVRLAQDRPEHREDRGLRFPGAGLPENHDVPGQRRTLDIAGGREQGMPLGNPHGAGAAVRLPAAGYRRQDRPPAGRSGAARSRAPRS